MLIVEINFCCWCCADDVHPKVLKTFPITFFPIALHLIYSPFNEFYGNKILPTNDATVFGYGKYTKPTIQWMRGRFECVRCCIDDIKVRVRAKMPTMSKFICVRFSINYAAVYRRRSVPVFVILRSAFTDTKKSKQTRKKSVQRKAQLIVWVKRQTIKLKKKSQMQKAVKFIQRISRILWNDILSFILHSPHHIRNSSSSVRTTFYTCIYANRRNATTPLNIPVSVSYDMHAHRVPPFTLRLRLHSDAPSFPSHSWQLYTLSFSPRLNIKIAKMQREITKYHGIARKHFHFLGRIVGLAIVPQSAGPTECWKVFRTK